MKRIDKALPTYHLIVLKSLGIYLILTLLIGIATLFQPNLKSGIVFMNFAAILGVGIFFHIFYRFETLPTLRHLVADNLVSWTLTRQEMSQYSTQTKVNNWEIIPNWFFYLLATGIPLMSFCSMLAGELGWVVMLIAAFAFLTVSGSMLIFSTKAEAGSDAFEERAIIGAQNVYWRKRLIRLFPFSESKPMRIEHRDKRYYFVAVSRNCRNGSTYYNEYWIPVPPGSVDDAVRAMDVIYEKNRHLISA